MGVCVCVCVGMNCRDGPYDEGAGGIKHWQDCPFAKLPQR